MTLEEAIADGYERYEEILDSEEFFRPFMEDFIADAVREWARENAELYFGGYGGGGMPQYLAPSHYSVPLDKFGGDA